MQREIMDLLEHFRSHVPDKTSNQEVWFFAADHLRWRYDGRPLFDELRSRYNAAETPEEIVQYGFEEFCVKCLALPYVSFDHDSPLKMIKSAIRSARFYGLPDTDVTELLVPPE